MKTSKTTLAVKLTSLISTPALAELEEVAVTAQKRAESLQDVPVAVSYLKGECITVDGGMTATRL